MKYKKGQLVKIKKCKVGKKYGELYFDNGMKKYIGKTAKITEIDDIYDCYEINIDSKYYWTDEMLEPVKEKKECGCDEEYNCGKQMVKPDYKEQLEIKECIHEPSNEFYVKVAHCKNCGETGITLKIMKGVTIIQKLMHEDCPNCGCRELEVNV